jgi:hypothetical protein
MSLMTIPGEGSCTLPLCLGRRLRLRRSTMATPMQAPTITITPTTAPMMMMPIEPLVSTADADDASVELGGMGVGGDGEGGGGGEMFTTRGGVTTASTVIETPVTFASMRVALLGLLVALAIVDCTKAAVTAYVWMRTSMMTLPGDIVNSTADGSTPARAAITPCI